MNILLTLAILFSLFFFAARAAIKNIALGKKINSDSITESANFRAWYARVLRMPEGAEKWQEMERCKKYALLLDDVAREDTTGKVVKLFK